MPGPPDIVIRGRSTAADRFSHRLRGAPLEPHCGQLSSATSAPTLRVTNCGSVLTALCSAQNRTQQQQQKQTKKQPTNGSLQRQRQNTQEAGRETHPSVVVRVDGVTVLTFSTHHFHTSVGMRAGLVWNTLQFVQLQFLAPRPQSSLARLFQHTHIQSTRTIDLRV